MGMATGTTENSVAERFTVARVRRDIFSRSTIGAVFTDRSSDGAFNRVAGLDTSLHFRDAWSFEGIWARVFEETGQGSTGLATGRLDYNDDLLGGTVKFIEIGENFDPGIGFVQRKGMRKTYLQARGLAPSGDPAAPAVPPAGEPEQHPEPRQRPGNAARQPDRPCDLRERRRNLRRSDRPVRVHHLRLLDQ